MAYMNQEKKKKIAGILKEKLAGVPIKYTLSVQNHSTIVCTIRKGAIDFPLGERTHEEVNPYYIKDHYKGKIAKLLQTIQDVLNTDNYNHSDSMTDYFCVGHYAYIHIGNYEKPYEYIPSMAS